jgi:hypothetical protein
MNKYKIWYKQITERGQTRKLLPPFEVHHILPKSLGGDNSSKNKTTLTNREHFICHWLLTKIYPTGDEHWKMLNALRIMRAENANQTRYSTRITSRVYDKLKTEYSILQSERVRGKNNPMYGKARTAEMNEAVSKSNIGDKNASKRPDVAYKISKSKTGVSRDPFSDEWKQKMSLAKQGENNNMFGKTHSDETKQKQREKAIGRKQSSETIAKKADAVRGTKREKNICPHCNKLVAVNGYARWHGDNCKQKA